MAKERLTEQRKQHLEELYHNLHMHNFYTILGIDSQADRNEIRSAYFALSKLCHPDNYADKDLGEHRSYMEKIFQACSKAYDVLGNDKKRSRYDTYLEKKNDTARYASGVEEQQTGLHQVLKEAAARKKEEEEELRLKAPPPVQIPEQPPVSAPPPSSPRATPSRPPRPSARPSMDPAARERHARRRKAWSRDSAKRRLLGAVGSVKGVEVSQKSRTWVTEARKAQEAGEMLSAINALRMAIHIDPGNAEAKSLLGEVMDQASGELGQRYYEQALSEMEFGEVHLAISSIQKAVDMCPDTPAYIALAARVILETDGDLHRAYGYAQSAASKEPRSPAHHLLLGKILLKAGLQARARSALGKAVEIDPGLNEARELLASLK